MMCVVCLIYLRRYVAYMGKGGQRGSGFVCMCIVQRRNMHTPHAFIKSGRLKMTTQSRVIWSCKARPT